ncbi:MAG: DUF92 domain-containing protein [Thermoactinomyces sp.]
MEIITAFVIVSGIVLVSYYRKALDISGSLLSLLIGTVIIFAKGLEFLTVLLAFFISSTLLTKYRSSFKKQLEEDLYEKTGTRDWQQVLANGAMGMVCAFLYWLYPSEELTFAYYASFAAANADTWASEIGVLSKKPPISIIHFRRVERGISGGVSLRGLVASVLGACLIGLLYGFFTSDWHGTLLLTLIGFAASLLDSVLGAVFQPLYFNRQKGILTEKAREADKMNEKVKGISWFDNDVVNLVCSVTASVAGWCLKYF